MFSDFSYNYNTHIQIYIFYELIYIRKNETH